MSLLISLRSELLKSKRTTSFYLTLVAAAVIPFIFLVDVASDGISKENSTDPFNSVFREGFMNTTLVIFPMFVILISTLLPQTEFKNNAWKQVLASPQTRLNLFAAKYINIHLLMMLFVIANNTFMLIAAVGMHFMQPALDLLNQPLNVHNIIARNINAYVTLLAISAIQFGIGLRFKNFILPVGIGFVLWFTGTLMELELHWSMAGYFPYTFHIYSIFEDRKPLLPTIALTSVIYTIIFLVLGFLDFNRKRK